MAGRLLAGAKMHRRWVRHSELRAVASQLAVTDARFRLRSLYTAMREYWDKRSYRVRLGRQAMTVLAWWQALTSPAERGRALWPAAPDVVMTTNASATGWRGSWDGLVPARGFHAVNRQGFHINLMELRALRLGLPSFVAVLREPGTIIRLRKDSRVAMEVINSVSSRSPALMKELRRLHAVCTSSGVMVRVEYPPSALNLWADRLSRTKDSTDWTLSRTAFLAQEAFYGPHTVGIFETAENAQCGRFYFKFPSLGGAGVDALRLPWAAENGWANSQFNLVGPVVDKTSREKAALSLVAPHWPAQPW
eukprot:contig_22552_g5569